MTYVLLGMFAAGLLLYSGARHGKYEICFRHPDGKRDMMPVTRGWLRVKGLVQGATEVANANGLVGHYQYRRIKRGRNANAQGS